MGRLSCGTVLHVIRQITAEPALLIYVIAADLQSMTSSALWYTKVCMHMYNDEWICSNINTNETLKEQEEAVERVRWFHLHFD